MKLVMHLGTHKTGTTTFQRILSNNHYKLMESGLWWELEYPVHHHAAWEIMSGGHGTLDTMIENAGRHGCDTVIVSSEEFEGALRFHGMLDAVEKSVRKNEISSIEWHVSIRDPGEYFASLYYELQKHFHQNLRQMYYDICQKGYLYLEHPFPDLPAPFCCFVFDYSKYLSEFQTQLDARNLGKLFVHDYAEAGPFPGWRILEKLNVIDLLDYDIPPLNVRDSNEQIIEKSARNLEKLFPKSGMNDRVRKDFEDSFKIDLENLPLYSESIAEVFGASYAQALRMASGHQSTAGTRTEDHDWHFRSRRSRRQRLVLALRFVYHAFR